MALFICFTSCQRGTVLEPFVRTIFSGPADAIRENNKYKIRIPTTHTTSPGRIHPLNICVFHSPIVGTCPAYYKERERIARHIKRSKTPKMPSTSAVNKKDDTLLTGWQVATNKCRKYFESISQGEFTHSPISCTKVGEGIKWITSGRIQELMTLAELLKWKARTQQFGSVSFWFASSLKRNRQAVLA